MGIKVPLIIHKPQELEPEERIDLFFPNHSIAVEILKMKEPGVRCQISNRVSSPRKKLFIKKWKTIGSGNWSEIPDLLDF